MCLSNGKTIDRWNVLVLARCIVTQVRQGCKILNWVATLLFQQVENQHRGPWDWNVKYLEKKWKNGVLSKQRNILYFFIVFFLFSSLSSSLFHRRISFLFFFLSFSLSYTFSLFRSLILYLPFSLSRSLILSLPFALSRSLILSLPFSLSRSLILFAAGIFRSRREKKKRKEKGNLIINGNKNNFNSIYE